MTFFFCRKTYARYAWGNIGTCSCCQDVWCDDGRQQCTGTYDDGRQVMAIAHLTLWVRWANNKKRSKNNKSPKLCFGDLMSSTKLLFFVPVGYSIYLPRPIICSDWPKFQRSSSLKLMNWRNPNCTGMIIGMSFTKLLFFMPIGNHHPMNIHVQFGFNHICSFSEEGIWTFSHRV
jgi:hypothetical protein